MPKLSTPEGEQLDADEVARRFNKAMAEPEPDEPTAPAPSRKDPDQTAIAVPGDEGQGDGGEDRKHTRARTTRRTSTRGRPKAKASSKAAARPEEGAYVQPVAEFLEGLTYAAAALPVPPNAMGVRVRLQGYLIKEHSAGLAVAIDAAARHNDTIRRGVESLTDGAAGWVLPAVMAVMPFAMSSAQLWRTPVDDNAVAAANQFQAATFERLRVRAGGHGDRAETPDAPAAA